MATSLPAAYKWLYDKQYAPLILKQAIALYGTVEIPGTKSNPVIMTWAEELGLKKVYSNDDIPWCGLFIAICALRAGWNPVDDPLWARNWAKFGKPVNYANTKPGAAALGDILVFPRGSGGHVAFYVGEDKTHYHILGGNQSNKVCIIRQPKSPILAVRRCDWRISQPLDVKPVTLSSKGAPTGVSLA